MDMIPSIAEKAEGAMLASAIGDALGWPNEFRSSNTSNNKEMKDHFIEWNRRSGGRYWNHIEKIKAGEYSDDTQMILAVSRSIISGKWEDVLIKNEIPFWLEYERGGGRALKYSAHALKEGKLPWQVKNNGAYFEAGGNGTVMRILPHVIASRNKNKIEDIIVDVIRDSIITHGHPRAILGASCYAYALNFLMNKKTLLGFGELIDIVLNGIDIWSLFPPEDIYLDWNRSAKEYAGYNYSNVWTTSVMEMKNKLEFIKESLKKGLLVNDKEVMEELGNYSKENGAGDIAILTSLYLASKYANNPELGIKVAAFSFGADTDTIASITGGLLGMLSGTKWIPVEWRFVQDYTCIVSITKLLLEKEMKDSAKKMKETNISKEEGWISSPIGKLRVISVENIKSGKTGNVEITKLKSTLDQTIYIKKFSRLTDKNIETDNKFEEMNESKHFKLERKNLLEIGDSKFLGRVTFKKIIDIIELLMEDTVSTKEISKKLKVKEELVKLIKKNIY